MSRLNSKPPCSYYKTPPPPTPTPPRPAPPHPLRRPLRLLRRLDGRRSQQPALRGPRQRRRTACSESATQLLRLVRHGRRRGQSRSRCSPPRRTPTAFALVNRFKVHVPYSWSPRRHSAPYSSAPNSGAPCPLLKVPPLAKLLGGGSLDLARDAVGGQVLDAVQAGRFAQPRLVAARRRGLHHGRLLHRIRQHRGAAPRDHPWR